MEKMKRAGALIMIVAIIMTCLPLTALAASSASGKSTQYGGNTSTFYVTTQRSASIKLTMGKGTLGCTFAKSIAYSYGCFEIKVYTKDRRGNFNNLYSKTNLVNDSSATIKLPSNTSCMIRVYAWRIPTIVSNLNRARITAPHGWTSNIDRWTKLPTWKATFRNCK